MDRFLKETRLLDYSHPNIQTLIEEKNWTKLSPYDRIGEAYAYVRDEIPFGYNTSDVLTASRVQADGFGQCNTKGTLFMALLRALGIPCRFHGSNLSGVKKMLYTHFISGMMTRNVHRIRESGK